MAWLETWTTWRNRLLASPQFQRFAVRFPLTRPIARRRARALFDLVAGFTYSQILVAVLDLRLLDLLAERPATTDDVARRTGLSPAAADRVLRAAASLRLVERLGAGWTLGADGAALRGNPGIAEMAAHHRALYADLSDPVALLRRGGGGGALARYWNYAGDDPAATAPYSALMAASQPLVAGQILDAYDVRCHERLLDVGGGEGAFVAAVAARAPDLTLGLFDLPAVISRAHARLDRSVTLHPGSFLTDPLPGGYDLISLVRVVHDHDDAPALALLRRVYAALPPGGRLLLAEPMAQTPGVERVGDGYFGIYLWAMGSGRPRSSGELRTMLRSVGFKKIRVRRTDLPLTTSVLIAQR